MDEPRPVTQDDLHATYLERSIQELERMVREEEAAVAELRVAAGRVPVPSATASLGIMATAYAEAARSEPVLPFADSVLPALLALRKTHQVTTESAAYVRESAPALAAARAQLRREKARLDDQRALRTALDGRLAALRAGHAARRSTSADERRRAALDGLRAQRQTYDRDTAALLRALKQFIGERLAPMLAAEAIGGPVVGSLVDVDADDLAAGFSAQGKRRKTKSRGAASKTADGDGDGDGDGRRQRRIDEMWGPTGGQRRKKGGDGGESDDGDDGDDGDDRDDRSDNDNDHESKDDDHNNKGSAGHDIAAAAAEMQALTEDLLNALAAAAGDSAAAYVSLDRESAAARFLVRAKVAQFHPRDATRLRLIDFGRDLDD